MAAGKGYDHVPTSLNYQRGGRSEIVQDPDGQSKGFDMTNFQTVLYHIAGMSALSC